MKKVWVVGAGGHVGTALIKLLDCKKYEILATEKREVDVTNVEQVHQYMHISRPDVIINCAGVSDAKICEEEIDLAYQVNAIGPRNLAAEAQTIEAKLIQISTDDVFDKMSKDPYNEFDEAHPTTIYGKSKYAGERMVKDLMNRYVIIRSSWVYGVGNDFLSEVLCALDDPARSDFYVPDNQWAVPTSAKELAKVVAEFIDHEYYGVYHAVCKGACSRYEYAEEILRLTDKSGQLKLHPVNDAAGSRPTYSVLDNMMLRISGMAEPKEWKEALREYMEETGGRE